MWNPTKTLLGIALCLGTAACGSDAPMNIGDVGVTGEKLSDYAGTWEGYAEAHEFEDGSDRVQLVLNANGQGTVQVGENVNSAFPKVVSAQAKFPFAADDVEFDILDQSLPFERRPAPGFGYPIIDAKVETNRINFEVDLLYPYADWCSGFTPFEYTTEYFGRQATRYHCHEMLESTQDGNGCYLGGETIECADLYCWRACDCDVSNCFMHEAPGQTVRLDGALNAVGNELVGTLVIPGERLTVRLVRQP